MGSFFKVFFACLLALLVAGFLVSMVIIGMISMLGSSEKPVVKPKTVLVLDIEERINEQGIKDELDPFSLTLETYPGLQDLITAIDHAKSDSMVKAIYLKGRGNSLGYAGSQELGQALDRFTESGKKVIAFTDVLPQRSYEIFHHASELYVQPGGVVEWVGLFVEVLFVKNLLDRLYIKPEIFYAGQFKSATEPFRMTKMSDANRLQYRALLEDIYHSLIQSISKRRGLDSAALNKMANNLEVQTAEQALEKGLIDGLLYDDDVRKKLRGVAGLKEDAEIPFMQLSEYYEATKKYTSGSRIAVVYADGNIVDGKGE
ncbi:MAG: S49 family peptidase, partial [Chitinophagaceae bacterium]|nr:S49 family peptidase [Chitinophagaceae bacterium]